MRNRTILAVLLLAMSASVVLLRVNAQEPLVDEDPYDTVSFENVCGGGWAEARYGLRNGTMLRVEEFKFDSAEAADRAFDQLRKSASETIGPSALQQDGHEAARSTYVVMLEDVSLHLERNNIGLRVKKDEALHIERNDAWLLVMHGPSIETLQGSQRAVNRRVAAATAPPN